MCARRAAARGIDALCVDDVIVRASGTPGISGCRLSATALELSEATRERGHDEASITMTAKGKVTTAVLAHIAVSLRNTATSDSSRLPDGWAFAKNAMYPSRGAAPTRVLRRRN